jgi:hypothetical protein
MNKNRLAASLMGAVLGLSLGFGSIANAEDLSFTLVNSSSANLVGFYVSRTGTDDWEENLLQGHYLPPNHEISVHIQDGLTICDYDILGEFGDESEAVDYDLDLCDLGEYTFTD